MENHEKWHREYMARKEQFRDYYKKNRDGILLKHKEYREKHKRVWTKEDNDRRKTRYVPCQNRRLIIRGLYGITIDTYNALLHKQRGVCAICGNPETATVPKTGKVRFLSVDHDHETNRVRGLLCNRCNRAIGLVGDNPDTLIALANYLQGSQNASDSIAQFTSVAEPNPD